MAPMDMSPPKKKMEKPIFKNFVVATSCALGDQYTDEAITRWVELRRGKFSKEMNDEVTHLVIPRVPTLQDRENPRVKEALKRGRAKVCRVVTLDWLEDALLKNRKLPETEYLLTTFLKEEQGKLLEAKKKARADFLEARFVNTNFYHLYHDSTYFKYEITITRDNPEFGEDGQRYILYLFESNALPHLYFFAAKLYKKKGDAQPNYWKPSESPQSFWTEYNKFKDFFKLKTGVDWDQRLIETDVADRDLSLFRYTPPVLGRPCGYVPAGFERRLSPPPEKMEEMVPSTIAGDNAESFTNAQSAQVVHHCETGKDQSLPRTPDEAPVLDGCEKVPISSDRYQPSRLAHSQLAVNTDSPLAGHMHHGLPLPGNGAGFSSTPSEPYPSEAHFDISMQGSDGRTVTPPNDCQKEQDNISRSDAQVAQEYISESLMEHEDLAHGCTFARNDAEMSDDDGLLIK